MNIKRFLAGGLVIFIIFRIGDLIVHGFILGKTYMSMTGVWRPDMMSLMWIMYLGSFIFSYLMMFAFVKGYEGRGILEGIRFGIIIGLLTNGMGAFYQYVLYPLPLSMILIWFCYAIIISAIAGIAASLIYKPVACYGEEE